jgi:hypothetical protein
MACSKAQRTKGSWDRPFRTWLCEVTTLSGQKRAGRDSGIPRFLYSLARSPCRLLADYWSRRASGDGGVRRIRKRARALVLIGGYSSSHAAGRAGESSASVTHPYKAYSKIVTAQKGLSHPANRQQASAQCQVRLVSRDAEPAVIMLCLSHESRRAPTPIWRGGVVVLNNLKLLE